MTSASESSRATSRQLPLDSFLPYRLAVVSEHVSQSFARIYGERYGIRNAEWRVISALGESGTMTPTEIGRRCRLHKTRVSRATAELESRGLISRRTSDHDMRVAHLNLTGKGRAMYEEIVPLAEAFVEGIVAELTDTQYKVLGEVLENLASNADKIARQVSEGRR